jgi:hypothetical protein
MHSKRIYYSLLSIRYWLLFRFYAKLSVSIKLCVSCCRWSIDQIRHFESHTFRGIFAVRKPTRSASFDVHLLLCNECDNRVDDPKSASSQFNSFGNTARDRLLHRCTYSELTFDFKLSIFRMPALLLAISRLRPLTQRTKTSTFRMIHPVQSHTSASVPFPFPTM